MKKTIGTILAVLCLAAALLPGSGTAFAQTAGQWTPREHPQDTIGCVNGAQSDEIIAQADRDLGGCKFTYRGKGKLTGWEVPLLEEGKDYKILSQSGRSITIAALDEEGCLPYINAKVQQPSAVASTAAVTTSGVAAVPPATKRETEAQAQAGDVDAFCALYTAYQQKLFHYAYYKLGNVQDAEDVVQDCMLTAFEQLGMLKKPEAFGSWLFSILYHGCAGAIKEQITRRSQSDIAQYANSLACDQTAAFAQVELQQALALLSDTDQNIILLSVVVGLKSKEVARVTGLTAVNVRQRRSRSLAKMKRYLS